VPPDERPEGRLVSVGHVPLQQRVVGDAGRQPLRVRLGGTDAARSSTTTGVSAEESARALCRSLLCGGGVGGRSSRGTGTVPVPSERSGWRTGWPSVRAAGPGRGRCAAPSSARSALGGGTKERSARCTISSAAGGEPRARGFDSSAKVAGTEVMTDPEAGGVGVLGELSRWGWADFKNVLEQPIGEGSRRGGDDRFRGRRGRVGW
jgi:hypothetical protein